MLRVGLFTEVYRPIVNGVVASIDMLRAALACAHAEVTTFAPYVPHVIDADASVVRFASLPLPTSTGYRLCLPLLRARDAQRARTLDIVHAHSPFVSGWFALRCAEHARVPIVFTYHTRLDAYAHYAPLDARIARSALVALTRTFANRANAVIVPTQAMRERLRDLGVRSPIVVIPTPIDVARFAGAHRARAVRALLGARGDDERVVVCVARLGREKGLERVIDALPQLARDVRLALIGAGPQRGALEERVRRSGCGERVRFVGALPPAVMPAVYAAADAFAFTSTTETQGIVLAEALAAGLPIVAADSPVAREVAPSAARVTPDDPSAFAAALERSLRAPRGAGPAPEAAAFARERFGPAVLAAYRVAQSA